MKHLYALSILGVVAVLSGCATSSQVQEMIDASNQDCLTQLQAHEDSITVLKKSAMAGLEKSSANADRLTALEKQVATLSHRMVEVQDIANASKVISAANTVKVSGLEEQVAANKEESDKVIARMTSIDKLYEKVLIRQFQEIADSANAAIESLKANGFSATTNAPVKLDEPIEIIAPDTTTPTNGSGSSPDTNAAAM